MNKRFFEILDIPSLAVFLIGSFFIEANKIIFIFFLIIGIVFVCKAKKNFLTFILEFSFAIIFFVFYTKFNYSKTIEFNKLINLICNINLREKILDYIDINYSDDNASIVKLLVLNEKQDYGISIYNRLSDLSVSFLIVISGFHLSLIPIFINKISKFKKTNIFINVILMIFVNYLTEFNVGSFRALIFYCLSLCKIKKRNIFYFSIIIIVFLAPFSLYSFSFQMSFLCILIIRIISKFKIQNKIISLLFTSIFINLFLLVYLSEISGKISLWFWFYSLLFTPIFSFLYIFNILFLFFPYYDYVFNFFWSIIFLIINFCESINVFIFLDKFSSLQAISYWILLMLFLYSIYFYLQQRESNDFCILDKYKIN